MRGLLATDPVGVRARVLLAPWRAAGGSFELRVPTIAIVLGRQVEQWGQAQRPVNASAS